MRPFWRAVIHRRRFESDLHDELAHHIEAYAADLRRQGLPAHEALRRARAELGSRERYKEECRQAQGLRWLDELRGDLRYALRGLHRNRAFAVVAILTLALGLGANTAVFSLVNAVMLKTLPVENPEQLKFVHWTLRPGERPYHRSSSGSSWEDGGLKVADMFSYPHYARLRRETQADLLAYTHLERVSVEVRGEGTLVRATLASWNYFRVLGLRPLLGRTFLPEDEDPRAPLAAVLNYEYWNTAFHGDRSVIGQRFLLMGQPVTITGVLPPGFHGLAPGSTFDVAVPVSAWDAIMPQPG
jgi:hypothetical protein